MKLSADGNFAVVAYAHGGSLAPDKGPPRAAPPQRARLQVTCGLREPTQLNNPHAPRLSKVSIKPGQLQFELVGNSQGEVLRISPLLIAQCCPVLIAPRQLFFEFVKLLRAAYSAMNRTASR